MVPPAGLAASLALVLCAGCLAPAATLPAPAAALALAAPVLLPEGGVALDVPVDVVLLGFSAEVAPALQAALAPLDIRQLAKQDWRDVPPADPSRPAHAPFFTDALEPLPLRPTAVFRVRAMPASFEAAFAAELRAHTLANASLVDANAVEDWLAAQLPATGLRLDPDLPALVLVHAGGALPQGHAYRYTYPNGYLEPVRVFGERKPLLVLDASAREDPWVIANYEDPVQQGVNQVLLGDKPASPKPYDHPLAPDARAVPALAEAARDAARMRLLQGTIVSMPMKPCHAVTLVLAVRAGALTETAPGFERAAAQFDPKVIERGWEHLLGAGLVHVDLKVVHLPQEDPALDAVTRAALGPVGGSRGLTDLFRYWVDKNWDRYWVKHDGCEPYVSVGVVGDLVDPGISNGGIALYDPKEGRRVNFAMDNDWSRLADAHTGSPLGSPDASREAYRNLEELFVHETAHLFGLSHPHTAFNREQGRVGLWTFSSVWTPMSYETGDRLSDFGVVEHANFHRNLAGFLVREAQQRGKTGDARFGEALQALAAYDWDRADALLFDVLA